MLFFCFADFFFADRFEDEIDSSRRDFSFSTGEEDVRGSSYRRFSSELLLFVSELELSPEILSEQSEEDSSHASAMFVCNACVVTSSYALTVYY